MLEGRTDSPPSWPPLCECPSFLKLPARTVQDGNRHKACHAVGCSARDGRCSGGSLRRPFIALQLKPALAGRSPMLNGACCCFPAAAPRRASHCPLRDPCFEAAVTWRTNASGWRETVPTVCIAPASVALISIQCLRQLLGGRCPPALALVVDVRTGLASLLHVRLTHLFPRQLQELGRRPAFSCCFAVLSFLSGPLKAAAPRAQLQPRGLPLPESFILIWEGLSLPAPVPPGSGAALARCGFLCFLSKSWSASPASRAGTPNRRATSDLVLVQVVPADSPLLATARSCHSSPPGLRLAAAAAEPVVTTSRR